MNQSLDARKQNGRSPHIDECLDWALSRRLLQPSYTTNSLTKRINNLAPAMSALSTISKVPVRFRERSCDRPRKCCCEQ